MEASHSTQIYNSFSLFLSALKDTNFKSESKTKFYELFTKPSDSDIHTIKVECTFDVAPSIAFNFLMEQKYVDLYDEGRGLLEEGENYKIFSTIGKGELMVEPRNLIILLGWKIEEDGKKIIIAGSSVEHSSVARVKGLVRAHCEMMGYELVDLGDGKTRMVFIGRFDPKDNSPAKIANEKYRQLGERFEKLNKVMKSQKNKKK